VAERIAAVEVLRNRVFGGPPYRVDILTSIDGVEFADAGSRRLSIDVDGLALEVIGRDDLAGDRCAP